MSATALRARGVSEIVDAAFALYRRDGMQYITLAAILTAPSIVLNLMLTGGASPTSMFDFARLLPAMVLAWITYALVSGAIIRMGSNAYLGTHSDVAATVREVLPQVPTLIGAIILSSFMIAISAVFLFFPVFYVVSLLFATVPVIVLERKGVFAAISRSSQLSKGLKWHILGTLALVYGIYFVLSLGIPLLAALIGNAVIQFVIQSVFAILAAPILNLVVMVLYYDARIRSEGFDVEHMAHGLGNPRYATQ